MNARNPSNKGNTDAKPEGTPEGTKPEGTKPEANGVGTSPADKLAILRQRAAEAEQAKAAAEAELAEAVEAARKAELAEAMEGLVTQLQAMVVAAQAGEAEAVVNGHAALTEPIEALRDLAGLKPAKKTGGRKVAGGAIRQGTDADAANQYLGRNPGWHTISQVAKAIGYDGLEGRPAARTGQVQNALEKLASADLDGGPVAEMAHNDGQMVTDAKVGTIVFRHRQAPDASIVAGVSTTQPEGTEGDKPEAPTNEGADKPAE